MPPRGARLAATRPAGHLAGLDREDDPLEDGRVPHRGASGGNPCGQAARHGLCRGRGATLVGVLEDQALLPRTGEVCVGVADQAPPHKQNNTKRGARNRTPRFVCSAH